MSVPSKEEFIKTVLGGKKINVYTWEFVRAAIELNLSYKFFTPEYENLEKCVEISNGKLSHRFVKAMFPLNDVVSAIIAKKKPLTNWLLKKVNIPVPSQIIVKSKEELKNLSLKFPLVVKPTSLTGGQGITANIKNQDELITAFEEAFSLEEKSRQKISNNDEIEPKIIIEEMIQGFDHRILVLDDEVIAAIKKVPARVVGDGISTLSALIEKENETEHRASKQISTIKIDNDLIMTVKDQGFDLGSVIPNGTEIKLHTVSNLSMGATTEDVTRTLHSDFKNLAINAVKEIGLRLAGVDCIANDISKPATEQSHGIIEVNAHPGSRLHLYPTKGNPVDVTKIILQKIFEIPT